MSARIEDVLAEHDWYTPRGYAWPCCVCGVEFTKGDGEIEAVEHVADMLREAGFGNYAVEEPEWGFVVQYRGDTSTFGPTQEQAAKAAAQRINHDATEGKAWLVTRKVGPWERAEDSPAPVATGDGGARPEAGGGEASSPGADIHLRLTVPAVKAAMDLLSAVRPRMKPTMVPRFDGGLQLEWHEDGTDLEVCVDADGGVSAWCESPAGEWTADGVQVLDRLVREVGR